VTTLQQLNGLKIEAGFFAYESHSYLTASPHSSLLPLALSGLILSWRLFQQRPALTDMLL